MKKLFLLIISVIIFWPLMAQETTNVANNENSKKGFISGLNFLTSTLSDNAKLSSLTEINDINQVNMGFDLILGYSTNMGFEYTMDIGLEMWNNKQNNKKITSISGLYSLNIGYRIEFPEKTKLAIVPRIGIGWNFNSLYYAEVKDTDITFNELSQYSWNVDQYANFYVPASLELRYKTSKTTSVVLGAEYRYYINYGDVKVLQTSQKISDFPKFSANELSFKLGYISIF